MKEEIGGEDNMLVRRTDVFNPLIEEHEVREELNENGEVEQRRVKTVINPWMM